MTSTMGRSTTAVPTPPAQGSAALRSLVGRVATAAQDRWGHVPAERLAGNRVVLGAYTLRYLAPRWRMFRKIHRTDPALFAPVGPVRVLRRPLPPIVADGLLVAEFVAAGAFTAGVAHRITGPVHSSLLLWTLSYRNSWSMIFHSDNLLVLDTCVAGFSPAADAWSLDAARRRGASATTDTWRYGHAIELMSALTTVVYWLCGVAKVAGPLGLRWATGDSLRSQVAADGLRKEVLGSHAAPAGVRLYDNPYVWRLAAAPSLALEILAPVAMAHPVVGRAWAGGAFGMHWGIKALMDITFRYQLSGAAYASFVPWEHVTRTRLPWVKAQREPRGGIPS